ncbi:MAG: transaldolase family protein, partial [Mycobacteriaceae bacterium]
SRVDTEIDAQLDKIGTTEALELKGKAALANARLAYAAYLKVFNTDPRFKKLHTAKANAQRALWASTGVKNLDYPDTLYVTELVAANTVNTMPEKTLEAVADHGIIAGDTIIDTEEDSQKIFDSLTAVGINLDHVFITLENEGVKKFEIAWSELITATQIQLDNAKINTARRS